MTRIFRLCQRVHVLYNVTMKTLSITEGRQNLGAWLKRALRGEDVGFLVDGQVVALRPTSVYSDDYALREYDVTEQQLDRAYRAVKADVKAARTAGKSERFTGTL